MLLVTKTFTSLALSSAAVGLVIAGFVGLSAERSAAQDVEAQPAAAQPADGKGKSKSKASAGAAEQAGKPDAAAAQRAYAAGTRAFEAGKHADAVQQLSIALKSGGLPNSQMAKALYYRGSALRKQGKPAQAISDLTTAVWLKNGLVGAEKTKATEERQAAYREAGLGETAPQIGSLPLDSAQQKVVAAAAANAPAAAPQQPVSKPGVQVVTVGGGSIWDGFSLPKLPSFGGSGSSETPPPPAAQPAAVAAPAPVAVAEAQVPAAASEAQPSVGSSWDSSTAVQTAQADVPQQQGFAPSDAATAGIATGSVGAAQPSPAPEASVAPSAPAPNTVQGVGQSIGGFFSSMFSGGSSAPAQATTTPSSPVMTGSTASSPAPAAASDTQTSSMVQRGPDEGQSLPWQTSAAPAPQVASKGPAGNFKLQVAAVRSQDEALRLAKSLESYPAVQAGQLSTEVDEAVIGNMGTFYRVRIGPYASAKEPTALCQTLKPQGFDCLVVAQ